MPDVERDTRVEALQPGDRFRWLQRWYAIKKIHRSGPTSPPSLQRLAFVTEEGATFLFPAGHFVAAEVAQSYAEGQ